MTTTATDLAAFTSSPDVATDLIVAATPVPDHVPAGWCEP